jgi:hypothetical protein
VRWLVRVAKFLFVVLLAATAATNVEAKKKPPALTPMELQAIQSKEFETTKEALFACVMSVFQDLGYTIDGADIQTGFITASSPTVNKTNFLLALGGTTASGNTKGTAFLESMPNGRARVRLNFVSTSMMSGAYGQSQRRDTPILDAQPYHVAWDKIDEALFVRKALAKPPEQQAAAGPVTPTPQAVSAGPGAPQSAPAAEVKQVAAPPEAPKN